MEERILITVNEASELLGVGRSTLLKLTKRKDFPIIRLKRKILINKKLLELWAEANIGFVFDD